MDHGVNAIAHGVPEYDDAPDLQYLDRELQGGAGAVAAPSGAYSGTRPATLRITKRSPGSASKMVWGSILESEHAITAVEGR